MDRQIVYPGAIPLETDLLSTNRNAMVGLGLLAQDLLGTATIVAGLPCTQLAVPSLNVQVGAGRIYSVQNLDSTAYSSLAADTTHQILKQGLLMDAVQLATPAPTTAGFSINYLIEATYQDVDTASLTLPYYNASNPSQGYSGPNNSGTSQATARKGTVVMQAKAGVAATTGTQTTPAADSGYVGLYVVTVAFGASSVLNASISVLAGAPFLTASLPTIAAFLQAGTGATTRVPQDKMREISISIADYAGADPTGATASDAAWNSAQTYIEALDLDGGGNGGGRPVLDLPPGKWLLSGKTLNKRIKIRGAGSGSTFVILKSGQTVPLFSCTAVDIGGTSVDDTNHVIFEGLTLAGNRVDSVTTGVSHGISCPDAGFTQATQYGASVQMSDVHITGFTGHAVFLGINRNWPLMLNCSLRYCNDSALAMYGYDGRFTACDFGQCKNYGVREFAGGANVFTGCNIYGNLINYVANASSNSVSTFTGCAFDNALQNAVSLASSTATKRFVGCRFFGNSASGANLYSDILTAASPLAVIGCEFILSVQKVKLLLETAATSPKVIWVGNDYDIVTTPYQTAITDDFTVLKYAGQRDAWLGAAGISTLSGYISGTEKVRVDANGLSVTTSANLIRSTVAMANGAAAAAGTLSNAPVAGNPTKWIPINDGGTVRYIPCW